MCFPRTTVGEADRRQHHRKQPINPLNNLLRRTTVGEVDSDIVIIHRRVVQRMVRLNGLMV